MRGVASDGNPLGPVLYKYAYYVTVRLSVAWRIPVLRGALPYCPDQGGDVEEGAKRLEDDIRYAVYMQLLFRPFRTVEDVLRRASSVHGAPEYWKALLYDFRDWRSTLESIAARARQDVVPLSKEWWACRTCECMRNYDLAARRRVSVVDRMPTWGRAE